MRTVIPQLYSCMLNVDNKSSKDQLATIIRREVEIDLESAGFTSTKNTVTQHEIELTRDGRKLEAVKSYKNRTGKSLMESKHAVEAAEQNSLPRF